MTSKPSPYYYLCQLFGALIPQIIVIFFGSLGGKILTGNVWLIFVENIVLTVLISHFFIRKPIKAARTKQTIHFLVYVRSVIIAGLIYAVISHYDYLVYEGFSNQTQDKLVNEIGTIGMFVMQAMINIILMAIWCVFYVAITSARDKKGLEQRIKEQQLATLMNQVNPHFLFNALNTIRGMIFSDQEKAADLVTQLSSLFRYNLGLEEHAKSSLKEELDICEQYLAIEKTRLGERLTVDMSVPEQYMHAVLPRMGLLTLIENSVKHGIAHLPEGGLITVDVKKIGDALTIVVSNPFNVNLVKSGTKIGLKNLEQRIHILFGRVASLVVRSDNRQFTAELSVPLIGQ